MKFILRVMLVFSLLVICLNPNECYAEGKETSGICGENLTWSVQDGILTISGMGSMNDYDDWNNNAPWEDLYITKIIIGNGVTNIGMYAFVDCTNLTEVIIPTSVTKIGSSAFDGCSSLQKIIIPESVNEMGWGVFSGCSFKTAGPAGGGYDYEFFWSDEIPKYAFSGCKELTEIKVPSDVVKIGDYAFSYNENLKEINLPSGLTSIGCFAFDFCKSLTSVNLPASVEVIGYGAFEACSSLLEINIPEKVTSIDFGVFAGCSSLLEINIPEKVTSIGPAAFSNCENLKNINLPNTITSIGIKAFLGCSSLQEVIIPESVTILENFTFAYCSSLESVTLPKNITSIPGGFFEYCVNLKEVKIPDSVNKIGWTAFSGCESLSNVKIPDGVTDIVYRAFDGCSSLKSINIPSSVKSIEREVFDECGNLSSIDFEGTAPVVGDEFIANVSSLTVTVPENCWDTYADMRNIYDQVNWKKTEAWKPFEDVVDGKYYYDSVFWAVENGITNGVKPNLFAPDETCTRGQIVTFLWRANGCPEPMTTQIPFTDVSAERFYYKAVQWAVENGITNGTSPTLFSPDAPCTRAQIVTFLWRSFDSELSGSMNNPFGDVPSSTYYYNAVLWAVENSITTGVKPNVFSPEDPCTRGQVVTFLYRANGI